LIILINFTNFGLGKIWGAVPLWPQRRTATGYRSFAGDTK